MCTDLYIPQQCMHNLMFAWVQKKIFLKRCNANQVRDRLFNLKEGRVAMGLRKLVFVEQKLMSRKKIPLRCESNFFLMVAL